MWVVVENFEITKPEIEDGLHGWIDLELGQCLWLACKLELRLLDVVLVEMHIAEGMDEIPNTKAAHLRDHVREEGIRRDIEGNAEEDIRRTLVELTAQLPISNVELKQAMTRRKRHPPLLYVCLRSDGFIRKIGRVPRGDDKATGMRPLLDLLNYFAHLIDHAAIWSLPRSPLLAVDGSEVTPLRRPFIPDRDTILFEVTDVGGAHQEPEQFVDDRTSGKLLCCEHGKSFTEIKPHLRAEDAIRPRTCAVVFRAAALKDMLQEIQILLHISMITAVIR